MIRMTQRMMSRVFDKELKTDYVSETFGFFFSICSYIISSGNTDDLGLENYIFLLFTKFLVGIYNFKPSSILGENDIRKYLKAESEGLYYVYNIFQR